MRLIIVSGLSGSGKSVALHVLEDIGYYCIDNMPAALLQAVIGEAMKGTEPEAQLLAVGVDARNRPRDIEALPGLLGELRGQGIEAELLFLQASDEVLLKRYRDSRRRHPLATRGTALHAAITRERDVLSAIINAADLVIDTSSTSIYELADAVRERVDRRKFKSLSVLIESFGFREGIPADADFVFDLRSLPNPYWTVELRGLTGLDREVAEFLDGQERFVAMYEDILGFLKRWIPQYETVNRGYLTVAIGCTGGQHRSVWMTEKLAAALREIHDPVLTRHNRLHRKTLSDQQSP
jgi:RNase adapter protein RapZ